MSLKNYWYIAAESRELKSKPLAVSLCGEEVCLFRPDDISVAAVEDRCAHRNMPLSQGRTFAGCVECPYHGWRYKASGECVHVPSLGESATLPRHHVRSFPVREQDGFLWVYPSDDEPASEPPRFPHYRESGWTTFFMRNRFHAAVESCLENFLDCPHTVFVHKGWFRNPDARELKAFVRSSENEVMVEFQGEPITKSLASRLFFPSGKELRHTDRFIMPNISRVDYDFGPDRHFIILSQCTPISEYETEVYTAITYRFGRIGALVRWLLEPVCRKIIKQDVDVLAVQTKQIQRFGGARFSHVETDLLGLKIQSMRRRAHQGQSPKEEEAEREIIIRF